VSNEITINSIQPEIFYVKLDSLKTKLVPLKTDLELSFKPQFNLKEPVILIPEQIEITGPAEILDTIFLLNTEKRAINKLDADIEITLTIVHPENTTIKPVNCIAKIPVEKFTEKEILIPIQIKNKPENTNIKLFPAEIKLTVLVGLSEFEKIDASKFEVFIDYKIIDTENINLEFTVQSTLQNIQILRTTPASVEYLIETN
jgi:YbbR domain-containing protein